MLNCVRNTELTVLKYGQLDNVNLRPTSYFISSQKKKNYESFMDKLSNQNSSEAGK